MINEIIPSKRDVIAVNKYSPRSLWEIATPEEVAASIVIFYPDDPMRELDRREDYARRREQAENLRFWTEVRRLIELPDKGG